MDKRYEIVGVGTDKMGRFKSLSFGAHKTENAAQAEIINLKEKHTDLKFTVKPIAGWD